VQVCDLYGLNDPLCEVADFNLRLLIKNATLRYESWQEEAIVYYQKARDFFNSDNVHEYHYAVPKDEKLIQVIQSYETNFQRYKTPDMSEEAWLCQWCW
jgi:hypothetical protein